MFGTADNLLHSLIYSLFPPISFPFCSYILYNVSWDLNILPLMLSLSEVCACTWCLNVLSFIPWRSLNLVWLSRSVSPGFCCLLSDVRCNQAAAFPLCTLMGETKQLNTFIKTHYKYTQSFGTVNVCNNAKNVLLDTKTSSIQ